MQNLLRSWIGAGRPFTVEQASQVVKARMQRTRERRVRAWLTGNMEPKSSELLALMQLFGPKFTNQVLETIGQSGAVKLEGWVDEKQLGHALTQSLDQLYFSQPGNGRKKIKVLSRLMRLVKGHMASLRVA